jgi:diacylglycerol O-acyltransferase / wax synthase
MRSRALGLDGQGVRPCPTPGGLGHGGRVPLTRLRVDELVNVWAVDRDTPMQIALLGIFDAEALRRPDGGFDLARIRTELATRARHVPPLARRIVWTRPGEGPPVWAADPTFDPLRHIESTTLPPGADLATWAANRMLRPLDRDRPLWRAEVVDRLAGGRFAVLIVVSHVVADGRAGLALAGALLDRTPDTVLASPSPSPAPVPPLPNHRELVRDRLHQLVDALRGAGRATASRRARRRQGVRQFRDVLAELSTRVPATSLPQRAGPGRRLAIVRQRLDVLQRTGHALGVTVNDLLLAAVAGGLRELLTARGEILPGLVVRTTIPAAGRPDQQVMNMLVLDLPVGEPDPLRRLALVHRTTMAGKARLRVAEGSVSDIRLPTPVARLAVRWGRRFGSRSISLSVTDLAGPPEPLWLAGARLVEAVPIAPLVSRVPLAVAALSYVGELVVSINADSSIIDLDVLADGTASAFATLVRAAREGAHLPPLPDSLVSAAGARSPAGP